MNEEQRAVLAAIHRMEGNPGTLIDEYTVARAASILPGDLTGNEYQHAAGRAQIRHNLDELEALGADPDWSARAIGDRAPPSAGGGRCNARSSPCHRIDRAWCRRPMPLPLRSDRREFANRRHQSRADAGARR